MIDIFFRKLPTFRGKQRIARFFLKHKIPKIFDVIVRGRYECVYKIPNLTENIGLELYINGIYEESLVNYMIDKIPKNAYVLDIGANIGAIALPVCKKRTDIFMICIEASPRVASYLAWNLINNKIDNSRLINKALSDFDGELVDFFSPVQLFGKGSLSKVFTEDSEKVESVTIDTLMYHNEIQKIDFIKIDIEGYEYHAFKGAKNLLSSSDAPDIIFEFVDWAENLANDVSAGAAQAILIEYGYKLFILEKNNKKMPLSEPMTSGAVMIFATKK